MSAERVARMAIERDTDDAVPDADLMARLESAVPELLRRARLLFQQGERDIAALVAPDTVIDAAGVVRTSRKTLLLIGRRASVVANVDELERLGHWRDARTLGSFLAEPAGPASLWLLALSERGDWYRTRISLTSKQVGQA